MISFRNSITRESLSQSSFVSTDRETSTLQRASGSTPSRKILKRSEFRLLYADRGQFGQPIPQFGLVNHHAEFLHTQGGDQILFSTALDRILDGLIDESQKRRGGLTFSASALSR